MANDYADDYAARLEAKRKDDEKRWRELQYQLSVGSPMGQTNKAIEAMQMLGQISGAGGTKPAASPFKSWLDAPEAAAPRPMLTPEQRAAQSRMLSQAGAPTAPRAGGRGSVEDERKRLEAMLGMLYKDKHNLTDQQKIMMNAAQKRWSELSGFKMPEGVSSETPRDWSIYKPWTWPFFNSQEKEENDDQPPTKLKGMR